MGSSIKDVQRRPHRRGRAVVKWTNVDMGVFTLQWMSKKNYTNLCAVVKWTEGSGGTTLLLYFAFALVHDSRGIEIVNFTTSLALSAGTLMASAGRPTPYRLVPAHFYPCLCDNLQLLDTVIPI